MMAQTSDNGVVNQTNDALSQMDQQLKDLRRKKLNPNGRYILPEDMNESQRAQWERSFESDPEWRLNRDNTWSLVPIEPDSEQYHQGKQAMDDVTARVRAKIKPGTGAFDPRYIPMRGGGHSGPQDWLEHLHFDPSRSGDINMAQITDVLQRMGIS